MLNQIINLQIQGTRQVSNQIRGVTNNLNNLAQAFNRSSNSQGRHQSQTRTSQQGLANIQAGLVQLSTWLLNANVRINNLFDNMTKRFIESESAVSQLKVTMGLAGESATDPMFTDRFREFGRFKETIDELAMSTEYTKKQVANAFTALVQSGRTGAEAMKMLDGTLRLATASGGQLDLGQAVDIATLTLGTLGGSVDEVDDNLNMLLKTSQKTKIGFKDLQQVLGGLRASYSKFAETSGVSREAELVALASATRAMGLSGAESAQKVDQFSRSLTGLIATTQTGELRKKHGKKVAGRFRLDRAQLLEFFGIADMSKHDIEDRLDKNFSELALAQDELVKRQFMNFNKTTEKYEAKSITELVNSLTRAYAKLYEKKGDASKAITQKALGTESAQFLLSALVKMGTDAGKKLGDVGKAFEELVATISKNNGELAKSQAEALQTLEKRIALVESAEDALSNTIFQHDVYANAILDTYKETLGATNKLMKNNETLASSISFIGRMMQFLTGVGTTLGFTLTAMATFSIALRYSINETGGAVRGLGGTLRAFSGMFLVPTMTVLMQMTGGIIVLGIAIVALMRYFSGAEGIGEGFKIVLEKIGDTARATGGIIQLAFSSLSGKKSLEELTNDFYRYRKKKIAIDRDLALHESGMKELTKEQYNAKKVLADDYFKHLKKINDELGIEGRKSLVKMELTGGRETVGMVARITDMVKNLASGLAIIGESAIQPIMFSLEAVFTGLKYAINAILLPVRALAYFFGLASDETSFMTGVLKVFGTILGVIISGYLLSGAWSLFTGALTAIGSRLISVTQAVANYAQRQHSMMNTTNQIVNVQRLNISTVDKLRLMYYQLTGQTHNYNQAMFQAIQRGIQYTRTQQQMINVGQGLMMGVTALGGAMTMLGDYTGDEATKSFGAWMTKIGMFGLMLPMILSGLGQFLTMLRAITVANLLLAGSTLLAWLPVLLLFGAIYTVYKLFSNTKPKKPDSGASAVPGQTSATSNIATPMGFASPTSSYLTPTTTADSYATPITGTDKAYASSYGPASTVNNNNQQVFNIKNINVNANNAQQFSESIGKQAKKTSRYEATSGISVS